MKNRNLLIIIILVAVIALAGVLGYVLPRQRTELEVIPPVSDSHEGVKAYLLITIDGRTYAPYALTAPGDYVITQKKKNAKNVVHVTEDSIQMESSTCDNQICVSEGIVTVDNKSSRILGSYIMCLPNGVTLELVTPEELEALRKGQSK